MQRGSQAIKHIIDEKPSMPDNLHGRLAFSVRYVHTDDLENQDVLNIGCGFGWFELYAADVGVKRIIGIEPRENDLGVARKYATSVSTSFIAANGLRLPFPDQSFDTVCCWEVLEHLPRQSEPQFFREVRRVLKPGGAFYLSTPHCSRFYTAADPAWWLIRHRHYRPRDVRALAERNGFAVRDLTVAGGFVEVASLWNLYVSKWIFRRRPFLEDTMNMLSDKDFVRPRGFTNIFCAMVDP